MHRWIAGVTGGDGKVASSVTGWLREVSLEILNSLGFLQEFLENYHIL